MYGHIYIQKSPLYTNIISGVCYATSLMELLLLHFDVHVIRQISELMLQTQNGNYNYRCVSRDKQAPPRFAAFRLAPHFG